MTNIDEDVRTWKPTPRRGRPVDGVERGQPGSRGLRTRSSGPPSALKVFSCFLPKTILVEIATASTAYAQATATFSVKKKTTMFHDCVITEDHILHFIAALFIMGEKKLPSKRLHWEKYNQDRRLMCLFPTYHDFSFVAKNLHFVDTSKISMPDQIERNKRDSFWKLGGFPTILSALFKKFRLPLHELTVDEFTIPFKGRHRSRMMNKDKPDKYHLKGFSLNEARTGYCLAFYMYRGAEERRPPNVPASAYPIHALLKDYKEVQNAGYHLFADNWFTGVGLVQDVASWGVDYTGTCRKDRVDGAFDDEDVISVVVPDRRKKAEVGAMREKREKKKWVAPRGTARFRKRTYGDVEIYCTQWMDNKAIACLSTVDCVQGTIKRKVLENNKKNGKFSRVNFTAPSCFMSYNFGKVGTDRMDQNVAQIYPRNRFVWPVKCFVHMLYMVLNNSFISWREQQVKPTSFTLRKFMNILLDEILFYCSLDPDPRTTLHTPYEVPGKRESGRGLTDVKSKDRVRGKCRLCRTNSRIKCATCNAWLCPDRPDRDCWTQYHLDKGF